MHAFRATRDWQRRRQDARGITDAGAIPALAGDCGRALSVHCRAVSIGQATTARFQPLRPALESRRVCRRKRGTGSAALGGPTENRQSTHNYGWTVAHLPVTVVARWGDRSVLLADLRRLAVCRPVAVCRPAACWRRLVWMRCSWLATGTDVRRLLVVGFCAPVCLVVTRAVALAPSVLARPNGPIAW